MANEHASKKTKTAISVGKVFYINYLKRGKTVTPLYYAELLGWFETEFQKKGPH